VAIWLLVASGGSAWATTGHTFAGEFGGPGPGPGDGQFGTSDVPNGPNGLWVMAANGDVFTADEGRDYSEGGLAPRVQRFDAAGNFQSKFALDAEARNGVSGLAVYGGGAGAAYVVTGRSGGDPTVTRYNLMGVKAYTLNVGASGVSINGSSQVAVDPANGTVYVTVNEGAAVASFDAASGEFLSVFDGATTAPEGVFCAAGLAVDDSHRVYVLNSCANRVDRFVGGMYETPIYGSSETLIDMAVEPVSEEVYVAHTGPLGMQVTHLSAGGAGVVYTFDAFEVNGVKAMTASGTGSAFQSPKTVYISDATDPVVERYVAFDGPTVVTGASSSIEARSAVLEGTIDPEGVDASYRFEYGTGMTYGNRSPAVDVGAGSDPVAASTTITGLKPNTTYHYRLVGSNASGSIAGADQTFVTGLAAADVGASFASSIGPRSARLNGMVNPNSSAQLINIFDFVAALYFEYGPTSAYGSRTNNNVLCAWVCGGDYVSAATLLSGLSPGTTYHYRLVGDNGIGGPQFGPDQTFTTAPAAGAGAKDVTTRRATLTGTIDPHGVATSYRFNYGTTASYGSSTPEVGGNSGDGERLVTQQISGLVPDTTYHVQVVATSADGVVHSGADGLFRTPPAPTAEATVQPGASADAITLAGKVNTFGQTGSYHFDVWSLDSSYMSTTAERPVAGNASAEQVSAALSGLPAGETFVVQLSVDSNDSLGVSDLVTFDTAVPPPVFPEPPGAPGAYGCGSPRLDAFGRRPKPGDTITISGQDLGVGGSVVLGDQPLEPSNWSATGFKVSVPEEASGTLPLTVNCGRRSNTIAVAIFSEPDNRFAITGRSVAGTVATLRVRVPGPGKLESAGANTRAAKVTVKRPGTASVRVRLSSGGVRALRGASGRTLKVRARVRFTPAGGRAASKTVTLTFKRGSGR
jgi:hypothetical protein